MSNMGYGPLSQGTSLSDAPAGEGVGKNESKRGKASWHTSTISTFTATVQTYRSLVLLLSEKLRRDSQPWHVMQ